MATTLFAAAIALVLSHSVPELARLRDFGWIDAWLRLLDRLLSGLGLWRHAIGAVLAVAIPTLVLAALMYWIDAAWFGLLKLIAATVGLFYCWGPRDLDLDVEAVVAAPEGERRAAALSALGGINSGTTGGGVLVDAVIHAALSRWFGVLFWFALLGPAGALLYRLTSHLARDEEWIAQRPMEQSAFLKRLADSLDWPAAQLMTLALALAADFDAVATAWRDFHAPRGTAFGLDLGFLTAAARASVDVDPEPPDGYTDHTPTAVVEMQQALALCWRILVVWAVVFALLVLAGRIG